MTHAFFHKDSLPNVPDLLKKLKDKRLMVRGSALILLQNILLGNLGYSHSC